MNELYPAGKRLFDGSDYEPEHDNERLSSQIQRVYDRMKDGAWRTLDQVSRLTGDPHASVSAQLRHLRKARWGAHTVEKRNMGGGLFEYRLLVSEHGLLDGSPIDDGKVMCPRCSGRGRVVDDGVPEFEKLAPFDGRHILVWRTERAQEPDELEQIVDVLVQHVRERGVTGPAAEHVPVIFALGPGDSLEAIDEEQMRQLGWVRG